MWLVQLVEEQKGQLAKAGLTSAAAIETKVRAKSTACFCLASRVGVDACAHALQELKSTTQSVLSSGESTSLVKASDVSPRFISLLPPAGLSAFLVSCDSGVGGCGVFV